jgi:CBS domain containing-hemolysin-like protein
MAGRNAPGRPTAWAWAAGGTGTNIAATALAGTTGAASAADFVYTVMASERVAQTRLSLLLLILIIIILIFALFRGLCPEYTCRAITNNCCCRTGPMMIPVFHDGGSSRKC